MHNMRKPPIGARPGTLVIPEKATRPAWLPRLGSLLVKWGGISIRIPGRNT